jgi:hypothetical protein
MGDTSELHSDERTLVDTNLVIAIGSPENTKFQRLRETVVESGTVLSVPDGCGKNCRSIRSNGDSRRHSMKAGLKSFRHRHLLRVKRLPRRIVRAERSRK